MPPSDRSQTATGYRSLEHADAIYDSLKRQADDMVLNVSPPYSSRKARDAFVHGYEQALRDIARGWFELPGWGQSDG